MLRQWVAVGTQSLLAAGAEHGAAERVHAAADRAPARRQKGRRSAGRRTPCILIKVEGKRDLMVGVRARGRAAAQVVDARRWAAGGGCRGGGPVALGARDDDPTVLGIG